MLKRHSLKNPRLEEKKFLGEKSDPYSKPLKVGFPEIEGGKKGKADPYQLIKKNEITVDEGEGELRNFRICGGSRLYALINKLRSSGKAR